MRWPHIYSRPEPEMAVRRLLSADVPPTAPSISPRQRTISLNQNLISTEREPILLDEKSNKTIFVQGNSRLQFYVVSVDCSLNSLKQSKDSKDP